MKQLFKPLLLLVIVICTIYTAKAQVPVAAQWHFTGNNIKDPSANHDNPTSVGGVDWVFSVLPTDKKEYIGCGYTSGENSMVNPVIFKLDNLGRLKWIKHITEAQGSGYQYDGTNFGYLTQVIKTPNGYAATGAAYTNSSYRCAILLEIDEDGNFLHSPTLFLATGYMQSFGRSLCIDDDASSNHSIYIAGGTRSIPVQEYYGYVYKIDYNSWQLTAVRTLGNAYTPSGPANGLAGNNLYKIRTRQTSTTTHEIFACGYRSASADDNLKYSIVTTDPYDPSTTVSSEVTVRDKDMWLVKLDASLNVDYEKAYDKNTVDYPQSLVYTEVGPYSARGIETAITGLGPGTTATQYLKASVNKDERAYDFTFTSSGDIAMVGLINQVAPLGYADGNGPTAVQTVNFLDNGTTYGQGGFIDPVRNYYYDEYMDGDGYLLKIDPSNGDKIYSKNISHYSSKDFYPQIYQNGQGNFVISASSSDYSPSGYAEPEEYDALLLETPDAGNPNIGVPDHIWRRNYHAEGKEDGMCVFALAQTADGGFIIGGDNDEDHDNFSISKFAPYCTSKKPATDFAIDQRGINHGEYYIAPGSSEVWPNAMVTNGSNIAARVIVQNNATLTIKDCELHFASSDHVYDYWNLADVESADGRMIGIVVEPGGKLEIINSTLSGMDDCQSGNVTDRYMWDGIVVQGNPRAGRTGSQQGTVSITNSAIVDARIGLAADDGHRHLADQVQPASSTIPDFETANYSSRYNLRGWYGGGIVNATDSKWENCRFSVNFQQYPINNSVTSTFEKCRFYGTNAGMADPCFYTDEYGKRLPPSTFFGDWAVDNIQIKDGSFFCPEGFPAKLWPVGIINIDGGFTIENNTFDNLSMGVNGTYTPGLNAYPMTVSKNTFTNVGNGLNLANGMNNLTIVSNTFNIPGSEITGHPGGILMQGCTGYRVQFNTFNGMFKPLVYATYPPSSRGVQVSFGSSWTDYNDKIDNNFFDNLRHPAIALQRNSNMVGDKGLRFKCNDFFADNSRGIGRLSGVAGGNYEAATMKQAQGYCEGSFNSPAGNRFYNSGCNNNSTPTSRERLYADFLVSQNVYYYFTSNATEPEYDPTNACVTNAYYVLNPCFNPIDRNVVCDPTSKDPHKDAGELGKLDDKIEHMSPEGAYYTDVVAERDEMVSAFARQYGQEKAYDAAGNLLEHYNRYAEAIAFYITGRNWIAANAVWSLLPQTSSDEQQYASLTRMAIDLFSAGKSWKDMNDEHKALVTTLSTQNTYPGFLSNAVTNLLELNAYGWSYAVEADQNEMSSSKRINNATASSSTDKILQIYPNPTTGVLNILSNQNGKLSITNIQGVVISTVPVNSAKIAVKLPKSLAPGIYYLRFVPVTGNAEVHKLVYNP
jgi:hypothetical protein